MSIFQQGAYATPSTEISSFLISSPLLNGPSTNLFFVINHPTNVLDDGLYVQLEQAAMATIRVFRVISGKRAWASWATEEGCQQ